MSTIKHTLTSGPLATAFKAQGCRTLYDALNRIKNLPYGRISDASQPLLVLSEGLGTCSSKHALAKMLLDEEAYGPSELLFCLYRMNPDNTPGISRVFQDSELDFIPELHCIIRLRGEFIDLTHAQSDFALLRKDVIRLDGASVRDVVTRKPQIHREFIESWMEKESIRLTFDEIWKHRERCIKLMGAKEK